MAKTKQQKEQSLSMLIDSLKGAKSVVFTNFQGLKVSESEELRDICRKQNIIYVASKKTLLKKALEKAGYNIDAKSFQGGVATIFGLEDEITPAQIIANFAKKHNVVKIFGGILEGKFIEAGVVEMLSKLPGKQQLLGQLVGTLNAPISGFVNVLVGNIRGLLNVLNGIKEKKV